ncbi:MAG: hypothetical protein ACR2QC_08020 [Gammaproteobacteria bacterium]
MPEDKNRFKAELTELLTTIEKVMKHHEIADWNISMAAWDSQGKKQFSRAFSSWNGEQYSQE